MYLGEIARNVILSLIDASPQPLLFGGNCTPSLNKQWGLDTAVLSEVEEAWQGIGRFAPGQAGIAVVSDEEKLSHVRDVIVRRLGFTDPTHVSLADADVVRQVCGLVVTRAACLSACAVAAILVQTGRARCVDSDAPTPLRDEGKRIGVGVDGRFVSFHLSCPRSIYSFRLVQPSLVEFYPRFESMMRETLRTLVGPEVESRVDIGLAKDGSGAGGKSVHVVLSNSADLMVAPGSRLVCANCAEAERDEAGTRGVRPRPRMRITPDPVCRRLRLPRVAVVMTLYVGSKECCVCTCVCRPGVPRTCTNSSGCRVARI